MQMNLFENIKIFIEIVDAGSFAQAAENLQIHRPAVTKALQQLEQESGVRLLQRTTGVCILRRRGKSFIVAANRCSPRPTICWSRSRRTGRSAVNCALICRSPLPGCW
ncbi:LysR family transcriptional regulator [Klebsiella pneumoniae]